jgi:menaquinone-9 beta-reductase
MVSPNLPAKTDVFVVGGGPAGLGAALAARRNGLEVVVADRARPPINKACAEGLMPDAIAALHRIGVEINSDHGMPFRGIRFIEKQVEAEASYPRLHGFGVPRSTLHQLMVDRVNDAGITTLWHTRIDAIAPSGVVVGGRTVRCRWIIGADGFHSRVRKWAGLRPRWTGARRIGFRRHFHVRPWTDFVEVYWHAHGQAYVTPVAPNTVCVAIVSSDSRVDMTSLPVFFPKLAARLEDAQAIGPERGAISMTTRLDAVTRGRIALIGDASGSVDAITGEGLALAFRQADLLGAALAAEDLAAYATAHRRIGRIPRLMARCLLLMDGNERLRGRALSALAAHPRIFDRLLAAHIGELKPTEVAYDVIALALRILAPGGSSPTPVSAVVRRQ